MPTATLDTNSAAVVRGDVLCFVANVHGQRVLTKALPAAIGVPGYAAGVATAEPSADRRVTYTDDPTISASITGVSPGPGLARVSSAARVERVSVYAEGDIPLGRFDAAGTLFWLPSRAVPAPVAGGSAGGKFVARAATTASLTLSGPVSNVQDTVILGENDTVFVLHQSDESENGPYRIINVGAGQGTLVRDADFNTANELVYGLIVEVMQGEQHGSQVWKLTTTTPITVGVTALEFEQTTDVVDHTRITTLYTIQGTPVLPGDFKSAATRVILDAGSIAFFQPDGEYTWEQPLDVFEQHNDLALVCPNGRARVVQSYAPPSSQADLLTNALIRIRGTVATTPVNTTIATNAIQGTNVIVVTSATGIVAGGKLQIRGNNNGGDALEMSDSNDVTLTEVVEVDSTYAGGTSVRLTAPLRQWHKAGCTVKTIAPVQNFSVIGLSFCCPGGTIASAILAEGAIGLRVERCAVQGFSRAGVNLREGVRDSAVSDLESYGEVNCIVFLESAMGIDVKNVRSRADGKRAHANGTPRALITLWLRCTSIKVSDCVLQHAHCGLRHVGGWHLQYANIMIRDMDGDAIRTRDGSIAAGGVLGLGVDMGASPLGALANAYGGVDSYGAEFAIDVSYANVTVANCYGTSDLDYYWFGHDSFKVTFSGIKAINHGPVSGTVVDGRTLQARGMRLNDITGIVESYQCAGCTFGLFTIGTPSLMFDEYVYDGTAGNSTAGVAMWLEHEGEWGGPRFGRVKLVSVNGIYFGAAFIATPDYRLQFDVVEDFPRRYTNVSLAINRTGGSAVTPGEVLELKSSNVRDVGGAAGASNKVVVNTGLCPGCVSNGLPLLVCDLPNSDVSAIVTGTGNAGDLLESNAAKQLVVNNATTARAGRLWANKTSGAAAVTRVSA